MLEAICYQQLTSFAAGARIEVDTPEELAHSLLGAGRSEAKNILTGNIQAAADKAGLGIEVVFLGMQGIHPPPEVAADYQNVIGAIQQKQALILQADAEKNRTLSSLAGSLEDSDRLYKLASQYQAVRDKEGDAKTQELVEKLDNAFEQAKGDIFATLRNARSYAYERAVIARADGERFAGQIQAYRAAPQIFMHEQRLTAIEEGLKGIRKFVIVADQNQFQVQEVDVTDKFIPGLTDAFGTEGSSSQ
jgi:membrane protease subunit HflK